MKIKTLGNKIQLKVDEPEIGGLISDSMPIAIECGEVIGKGDDVTLPVKVGDKIFYKSWAVDIVTYEGKKYFFISQDTNGICAVIN